MGHGIVFTYPTAALKPVADLVVISSRWRWQAARANHYSDNECALQVAGHAGPHGQALAGIDMALWDALARLHSTPLWRLLGAAKIRRRTAPWI